MWWRNAAAEYRGHWNQVRKSSQQAAMSTAAQLKLTVTLRVAGNQEPRVQQLVTSNCHETDRFPTPVELWVRAFSDASSRKTWRLYGLRTRRWCSAIGKVTAVSLRRCTASFFSSSTFHFPSPHTVGLALSSSRLFDFPLHAFQPINQSISHEFF